MESVAKHDGVVTRVAEGKVTVRIQTISACGSCEAHGSCGFAESKDREVDIDTARWRDFSEGDPVVVAINHTLGFQAVVFAYLLPSVVLLASVLTLLSVTGREVLSVLLSLALLAVYFLILYGFRHRLQRKFTFQVSHRE